MAEPRRAFQVKVPQSLFTRIRDRVPAGREVQQLIRRSLEHMLLELDAPSTAPSIGFDSPKEELELAERVARVQIAEAKDRLHEITLIRQRQARMVTRRARLLGTSTSAAPNESSTSAGASNGAAIPGDR